MAPTTYIKLDRGIIHWAWYTDADTFRVFIHLLIKANIEDFPFCNVIIRRGSLATSNGSVAEELRISVGRVRKAMGHLKETGEIKTKIYNKFQVVTIVNYDFYQNFRYGFGHQTTAKKDISTNTQPTGNQQATDSQPTTIKEINKLRNQEINKLSVCDIKKEASFSYTEKEDSQKKDNAPARKRGKFNNVILTDGEYALLKDESENYEYYINKLSSHMQSTGRRYVSHYATLCSWIMDDIRKGYKIPVQIVNGEVKSKASYDIELAMKKAKTQVPEFKKRERR
ncbi:MAG: hypothetical protein IKJ88_09020 [Clostridia bacterium]|nr:hypothetical protein [Clostridia bacterium]MBR3975987.1 hypothetical protein [Clostridia bacterium]